MLEIGKEYEFNIQDMGMNFEGIAKADDGLTVFIKDAIVGEKVIAKIEKITKTYAVASISSIQEESRYRIKPICQDFYKCGGCNALHIDYDKTLDIKCDFVKNTLTKQGLDARCVLDITGMGNPYWYRNKVQYPVRNINGKNAIGMFSKSSHNLVENKECFIQDMKTHKVAHRLFEIITKHGLKGYNETSLTGDVRNILVRRGIHTDEIMCVIVATSKYLKENIKEIANEITNEFCNIKSVVLNVNDKNTNVILGDKNILIYGREYITDYIGDYIFNITANSFFQVNTIGAEVLYNILKESLDIEENKTLLELYSGVGSIGIFLANKFKKIYSVEIVPSAVEAAKENAKINGVKNITYILGDATKETLKLKNEGMHFDYIVVDPPRKGLDQAGIDLILKLRPEKIGYVSCNPATLARDLKLLSDMYDIKQVKLVDMFPWTRTC